VQLGLVDLVQGSLRADEREFAIVGISVTGEAGQSSSKCWIVSVLLWHSRQQLSDEIENL